MKLPDCFDSPTAFNLPQSPMSSQSVAFRRRIKKTLYYGKFSKRDRPSLPVTRIAVELFSDACLQETLERLDMDRAAYISRGNNLCPCSFMLAFLYLDRLGSCNPQYLKTVSSSKLFIASMMVAGKFLYEDGEENQVYNEDWADTLDMDVADLNTLEIEFLQAIDWNVFVSECSFTEKLSAIERTVAMQEARRRGWFTYTDLNILSTDLHVFLTICTENILKVFAVFMATYISGIVTLVGSYYLASELTALSCRCVYAPSSNPLPAANTNASNVIPEDQTIIWNEDELELIMKSYHNYSALSSTFITIPTNHCEVVADCNGLHELKYLPQIHLTSLWHHSYWKEIL